MQKAASPAPAGRVETAREFVGALWRVRREQWGNPLAYLFVAPAVILYLVFNVWPVFRGLAIAFTDYRFLLPGSEWAFNGLDNFREMLSDDMFWQSFGVAIQYTLLTFPTGLALSLGAAVLISQIKSDRAAAAYRVIVYLPVVLPIIVAMGLWTNLYHFQLGYINQVLRGLFGITEPPNWLGDTHWALISVAVASLWKSFGSNTLLFLIGIYGINRDLYEASGMDGASGWAQLRHITLPLLKPIFVLVLALNAGVVSATEEFLILTRGGPAYATTTTGLYLYQISFQMGDQRLGYGAAMSLVLGLIHMILAALIFKFMRTERA